MRSWVCATANTRWKACSFTRSRYSRSTATPCSRIFWRRVADGQETSMDMPAAIRAVTERRDLRSEEMTEVMRTIMTGGATSAQIGGFLIGLRMKGETVDEIAAAARVMRELASRVEVSGAHVVGAGFMFAPLHHGAMKHAIGPRREMGVRTVFNLLGPLTNPADAPNQVVGVFDPRWLEPLAQVLQRLGSHHALVVHGEDGVDEISVGAPTQIAELKTSRIHRYAITPEQFGLPRTDIREL